MIEISEVPTSMINILFQIPIGELLLLPQLW